MTTAIYAIAKGLNELGCIHYAVDQLSQECESVLVVHESEDAEQFAELLSGIEGVSFLAYSGAIRSPMAGYKQALLHLQASGYGDSHIVLSGSHVFGPIGAIEAEAKTQGCDLFSCYWHNVTLDVRLKSKTLPERAPYLDFAVCAPSLLARPAFWDFWQSYTPLEDPWEDFTKGLLDFAKMLEREGCETAYPHEEALLGTADPRLFEVDKIVCDGGPVIPVAVFMLDPLLHDLNAIDLRRALDWLRDNNTALYQHIIRFVTRHVKLREFATTADQYEVIGEYSATPDKSEWSFGRVAVFIHAYYADMMPEFWRLIERLPVETHLFLTTATEENATLIRSYLAEKGLEEQSFTVRVVEQNRGRDMSSLFITWRDVVLGGEYEVALRLHSKRTPQVSRQVGNSFRDHLFENLVQSPGYVRNVLNRMEKEPDIGLIIPPVIHVGFGTLGHSWFNNKTALHDLAKQMYIEVPLDDSTPVAAYGTMYWFRTDALAKMFRWEWKWEDYNQEPHHIDGGLAHIQERLIGYCIQDKGYRVLQVMNTSMAARYYAKLEYKLQLFSSFMGSNNALDQQYELSGTRATMRVRTYRGLRGTYGKILRRFPAARKYLMPFKKVAVSFLSVRR